MRQIQPDVWETDTETPFPGLKTHACLLTRQEGNVLFYNTGQLYELDHMAELGGVSHQFLSHRDELGEPLNRIAERFGSLLGGHSTERDLFARIREPDILFGKREVLLGNIEVIPTPGHSPGSSCFLVSSPHRKRYLFTGDTLYLGERNTWTAGFIPSFHKEADRPVLADSLRLLRDLEPDVVFGSAFSGEAGFQEIPAGSWPRYVDDALERLLRRKTAEEPR